jgi:hypothetical protein
MAGLVPAIHVLRALEARKIVAGNPDWNDLFETITK